MWKNVTCLTMLIVTLNLTPGNAAIAASLLSDPDLVGWWTFDEGAGTIAADSSPNGNYVTAYGGAEWIPGVYGSAIDFDGTDDYVGTGQSFLNDVDAFTLGCWLKGDLSSADRTGLIGQDDCIEFGFISSNTILIWTPGGGDLSVSWPHDDSQWHHIVAVGNGSSLMIYIDGEQAGTGGTFTGNYGTSSFPVNIGGGGIFGVYQGIETWFTGQIDDAAIFTRALTADEVVAMMKGVVPPELAANPNPAEDAIDVPRDVVLNWAAGEFAAKHNVYFGTSFEKVNNADPETLVSQGQVETEYTPESVCEFGQTYYWCVDEVNDVPDNTVFVGKTWNFTVEPIGYPIANVTATASSSSSHDMGPENTVNGSGLDDMDQHSTLGGDMWLSGIGDAASYIRYEFDKAYKLHQLLVWNSNWTIEASEGLGAKDVTIEYSVDGIEWSVLEGATLFNQATGMANYTANTTIEFGSVIAQFVKITINAGWGELQPKYGLSEVRFLYIPTFAREPKPAPGSTTDSANVILSWRPGREAALSEVYLGTDAADLALLGTTTGNGIAASGLSFSTTYFWSVTEVNDAEAILSYAGDVWSFITSDFAIVDSFDQYDDNCNRIFFAWEDGLGHIGSEDIEDCNVVPSNGNGGGSMVGNDMPPFAEKTIVNAGSTQSLPIEYDNSVGPSEITLTLSSQDWTASGARTLSFAFRGVSGNTGELFARINNTKTVYDRDLADIARPTWHAWNIDLTPMSGLENVTKLTIGVDGVGAAGKLYIDDIRLYPLPGELITLVEPNIPSVPER